MFTKEKKKKKAPARTSKQKINRALLVQKVFALRRQGLSLQEVGDACGFTKARAWRIISDQLDLIEIREEEDREREAKLLYARLEHYLSVVSPLVDKKDMGALDRALAINDRLAKLLGLNAPEKKEIDNKNLQPTTVVMQVVEQVTERKEIQQPMLRVTEEVINGNNSNPTTESLQDNPRPETISQ